MVPNTYPRTFPALIFKSWVVDKTALYQYFLLFPHIPYFFMHSKPFQINIWSKHSCVKEAPFLCSFPQLSVRSDVWTTLTWHSWIYSILILPYICPQRTAYLTLIYRSSHSLLCPILFPNLFLESHSVSQFQMCFFRFHFSSTLSSKVFGWATFDFNCKFHCTLPSVIFSMIFYPLNCLGLCAVAQSFWSALCLFFP